MEHPSHSPPPTSRSDTPTLAVKKERNVVTWTPQEDERLRDEVAIHGVDNWTIVAGMFKDKTGRQCRRRWYTYLNAECKKGGWSAEEDMLLCEAQKMFGNKWTEIAKVVSGRTDNAVKNRFSTLCKKRAKVEDSAKENTSPFSSQRNKRVLTCNGIIVNGISEASMPTIHARYGMSDFSHQRSSTSDMLLKPLEKQEVQLRRPLAVLGQNSNTSGCLPTSVSLINSKEVTINSELSSRIRGAFFNQDDPRVTALLRQADLLSSLAAKVNTENTSQSLEDAWKELQDYLGQTDVTGLFTKEVSGMGFTLEDFEDLVGEMKCANIEDQLALRDPYLHEETQATSEYSIASSDGLYSQESINIEQQAENCLLHDNAEATDIRENVLCRSLNSVHMNRAENVRQQAGEDSLSEIGSHHDTLLCPINNDQAAGFTSFGGLDGNGMYCLSPEFSSPLQTMPIFTEGLPTPQFSTSERQTLLNMFGLSSPVPSPNSVKMPSCKKALIDSLCPS